RRGLQSDPPLRRLLRVPGGGRQARGQVPAPLRIEPDRVHRGGRRRRRDDGEGEDPRPPAEGNRADGAHLRGQSGPRRALPVALLSYRLLGLRLAAEGREQRFRGGRDIPWKTVSTTDRISNVPRKYPRGSDSARRNGPRCPAP